MPLVKKTALKVKKKAAPKKPAKGGSASGGKASAIKKTVGKKIVRKRLTKPRKITPPIIVDAEASKYYLAEPDQPKLLIQSDFNFPAGYGDNRIVLMVRDPHWAYTYWELSGQRLREIAGEIGEEILRRSQKILRVYEALNWNYFDVDINNEAINWYIKMPEPDHSYCVEIGFVTPDGRFVSAAKSNVITMPRDQASDVIDPRWVPGDWDNIYSLSGGGNSLSGKIGSFGWISSFSLQRH